MTTLNARASQAYEAMEAELAQDDCAVWFTSERDAFEDGWETGYKAAGADMLQRLRALRADAITFERQNAYDRAIEAAEGLS